MMAASPNHGSVDLPRWIAMLVDPHGHSQEERNRAMDGLRPVIDGAARSAAARFDQRWRLQLIDEAPRIIWERLASFDPNRGTFPAWCWTVLHHAFADLFRELARAEAAALRCAEEYGTRGPADWQRERQKHNERVGRMREILDSVARRPGEGCDVHLYAVLLMRLRQGMTVLVSRASCAGLPPTFSLARFIEDSCLVWRPWEAAERFKADWPSLQEIWDELRPIVDRPPHRIEAPELCDSVTQLSSGRRRLSPGCWNRWVKRAKDCVRIRISREDWDELFAPLLPDSSRFTDRRET